MTTSKDQQIKIISLLKYSGKTVSQMIFYMLAKYVPGDIKAWQFHTPGEIAV
jgi:hypothetical protein